MCSSHVRCIAGLNNACLPLFDSSSSQENPEVQSGVSGAELLFSGTDGKIPTGTESFFQRAVSRRYPRRPCTAMPSCGKLVLCRTAGIAGSTVD